MQTQTINIKREELCRKVWEKPLTSLAKEFGLSDNGLAKICKYNGIPLPGRGYWAKIYAGRTLPKKFLNTHKFSPEEFISITTKKKINLYIEGKMEIEKLITFDKNKSNKIFIKPDHSLAHNISKKIKNNEQYSSIIRVSDKNFARALAVLDVLLLALEERGFQIKINDGELFISYLNEPLRLYVFEMFNIIKTKKTEQEIRKMSNYDPTLHDYYKLIYGRERREFVESGKILIRIESDYINRPIALDNEKSNVEHKLNKACRNIYKIIKEIKEWKQLRLIEEKQREDDEKIRIKKESEIKLYEDRLKIATTLASQTMHIENLSHLLKKIENMMASNPEKYNSKIIRNFTAWIDQYLQDNDLINQIEDIISPYF